MQLDAQVVEQNTLEISAAKLELFVEYGGDIMGTVLILGPIIETWNKQHNGVPLVVDVVKSNGLEIWPTRKAAAVVDNEITITLRSNPGIYIGKHDVEKVFELFNRRGLKVKHFHLI